jgi:hypothetical protein
MRDVRIRSATEGDFAAIAAVTIASGQHDDWGGSNPAYRRFLCSRAPKQ